MSETRGIDELVRCTRPLVCFFGHHHTRLDAEIAGVRCIGLNEVAPHAILVAFGLTPDASTGDTLEMPEALAVA